MARKPKTQLVEHAVAVRVVEPSPPLKPNLVRFTSGSIAGLPYELSGSLIGATLFLEIDGRQFTLKGADLVEAVYSQVVRVKP